MVDLREAITVDAEGMAEAVIVNDTHRVPPPERLRRRVVMAHRCDATQQVFQDTNPEPVTWFVLNTEAIVEVDITAVDALESLRRELTDRGIVFACARMKQDLRSDLAPSGLLDRIGEDRVFPTLPTALEAYQQWRVEQD